MVRPTFDQFRKKALSKSGVKAEYDALALVCEMQRQMIALRQATGLTQEQMAAKLGTRTLPPRPKVTRMKSKR